MLTLNNQQHWGGVRLQTRIWCVISQAGLWRLWRLYLARVTPSLVHSQDSVLGEGSSGTQNPLADYALMHRDVCSLAQAALFTGLSQAPLPRPLQNYRRALDTLFSTLTQTQYVFTLNRFLLPCLVLGSVKGQEFFVQGSPSTEKIPTSALSHWPLTQYCSMGKNRTSRELMLSPVYAAYIITISD